MAKRARKSETASSEDTGGLESAWRVAWWLGAAAGVLGTVLGVVFNLDRLGDLVTDRSSVRDTYRRALETADVQLKERKYDGASATIAFAVALRQAQGWKLRGLPSVEDVQAKEADVAMAWLRDIRLVGESKTFTSVVERVEPVLQREEPRATGVRKADVVAHLGYADFLRSRDGAGGLAPEARYREALAIDPKNPFANTLLAHWLMWRGKTAAEVDPYFQAAIASDRERPFVRRFQLAALMNQKSDDTDLRLVRLVNEMRKSEETVDDRVRSRVVGLYFFYAGRPEALASFVGVLPPAEHVAFLRWLVPDDLPADERIKRDVYDALIEASTNDPAARDHLLALRARVPVGTYRQAVEWGLRSLPGGADPPAPRRAATRR